MVIMTGRSRRVKSITAEHMRLAGAETGKLCTDGKKTPAVMIYMRNTIRTPEDVTRPLLLTLVIINIDYHFLLYISAAMYNTL